MFAREEDVAIEMPTGVVQFESPPPFHLEDFEPESQVLDPGHLEAHLETTLPGPLLKSRAQGSEPLLAQVEEVPCETLPFELVQAEPTISKLLAETTFEPRSAEDTFESFDSEAMELMTEMTKATEADQSPSDLMMVDALAREPN